MKRKFNFKDRRNEQFMDMSVDERRLKTFYRDSDNKLYAWYPLGVVASKKFKRDANLNIARMIIPRAPYPLGPREANYI